MILFLLACAPDVSDSGASESITYVMHTLSFGRRAEDGTTWGFDLDGQQTEKGDASGCGHQDLMTPEGEAGVDSAFSGLVPALERTEAAAAEGLVQDSIRAGELLILVEVTGIDDWESDDCVGVRVLRGQGTPLIGTDGELLDGQSFGVRGEPKVVECAQIRDGALWVQGFDLELPIQILDVSLIFSLQDAALRMDLDPEGGQIWGYLGGPVPLEQILAIIADEGVSQELRDLVVPLLEFAADMDPDALGECQSMSLVLEFDARSAFVVE